MASKYTPTGTLQHSAGQGTTKLLTAMFAVPPNANSAIVSAPGPFAFRLDGLEGVAAAVCMPTVKLVLSNREMIASCVIVGGGLGGVHAEFFTGRAGISE